MENQKLEYIEIRVEKGLHIAYFRGMRLPALIDSTITQGTDVKSTEATLRFQVRLEEKTDSIELKGSDLIGIISNNNDKPKI